MAYSETFFIVDGVPPFTHELVEAGPGVGNAYTQGVIGSGSDVEYDPPNVPTVPDDREPGEDRRDVLPGPDDDAGGGLDYANAGYVAPPEGVRLDDDTGVLGGMPRRAGTFRIHYHVSSQLVPAYFGQQNWATFEVYFAPSALAGAGPGLHGDRAQVVQRRPAVRA